MRGIMKKFAVLMLALASLGAMTGCDDDDDSVKVPAAVQDTFGRSEEHTSELQSP